MRRNLKITFLFLLVISSVFPYTIALTGTELKTYIDNSDYYTALNTPFAARDLDVTSDGTLYAITWDGVVYSTTNNGSSWTVEHSFNVSASGGYRGLDVLENNDVLAFAGEGGLAIRNSSGWFDIWNSSQANWGLWHSDQNPLTGDIYIQSHSLYLYNSTDGGNTFNLFYNMTASDNTYYAGAIDDHFHALAFDNDTQTLWVSGGDTRDIIRRWNATAGWEIVAIDLPKNIGQPTSIMFDDTYVYFGQDAQAYVYRLNKTIAAGVAEEDFEAVITFGNNPFPDNQWSWECKKIGSIYYMASCYNDGIIYVSMDGEHWVSVFEEDGYYLSGSGEPVDAAATTKGGIPAMSNRLPLYFIHNTRIYLLDISVSEIRSLWGSNFRTEETNYITWSSIIENGSNYVNLGEIGLEDLTAQFTGLSVYETIDNRTFEPGLNGSWTEDGYGAISVTDADNHTGSYCLLDVVPNGTAFASIVEPPNVDNWGLNSIGEGQYFFSVWLKTNVTWTNPANQPNFYLSVGYRSNGVAYNYPVRINITTSWDQFSQSMYVPASADRIQCSIQIYRELDTPREVYIDDAMFWGGLRSSVLSADRQRYYASSFTNSWSVAAENYNTSDPEVIIGGNNYTHSGEMGNGTTSTTWDLNATDFYNGTLAFTASMGSPPGYSGQVFLNITASTRRLKARILNRQADNWVFVGGKEFYRFQVDYPFNSSDSLSEVRIGFSDSNENWIIISYDVANNIRRLINGTTYCFLSNVTSEEIYLGLTNGINILKVTYYIGLMGDFFDRRDVSIYGWCSYESGWNLGWVNAAPDYFNILNLGGLGTITTGGNGTAGRLPGGDIFDLYVITNNSGITYAESTATFRNLQHIKLLPRVNFIRAVSEPTPYFTLTYQVSYYVDGEWVNGFSIKIKEDIQAAGSNRWFNWTVEFYQGSTLQKSERWYLFFLADSVTPSTGENSTGVFWVDMWFNKINASSTGGIRVNAYQYPMTDSSNTWLRWLTGSNWGISENLAKQQMGFTNLLDSEGNIISTPKIELVNITCRLEIELAAGRATNLTATVGEYDVFDLTLGADPFTGVQTPVFDESLVPSLPQGGFLGAIWSGLMYVAKVIADALGPAVLGFFNQFVGFLDSIAAFFGAPGLFSQILTFFSSAWDWFLNSVTWVLSLLTTFFSALLVTMTKFTSLVSSVVGQWVAMIQTFIGILDGAYTSGVSVWTDLGLATWLLLGAILYPLYLMEVAATKGVNAAIAQVQFLLNIAAFLVNGFISVIQLIINLISSIIEAIPVVE